MSVPMESKIREIRKNKGIRQKELADLIGERRRNHD